jgi:hypothetical protein
VLFRTVYGPELPALHKFVAELGAVSRLQLQRWFVQAEVTATEGSNLEEAVAFLLSAGLFEADREQSGAIAARPLGDFRLALFRRLQEIARSAEPGGHSLDPWFLGILDHAFIKPNRGYIPRLHGAVNSLELPAPCSEEKVNAWRRVMEYLGCGYRIQTGFLACYRPDLVLSILRRWRSEGPLEEWLRFAEDFVPVFTRTGDLANAMALPIEHLERSGCIRLAARGDLVGRGYLGERRIKWLTVEG